MKRRLISLVGIIVLVMMLLPTATQAVMVTSQPVIEDMSLARTVNWAQVDGGSSVTVAPGASITATLM